MASDGDLAALRRQQERLTQWSGQIVIIDLLCMMVLPLERLEVPGTGFVVNDVAVAFLAVLAAFRAPKIKGQHLTWVPILLATAVGILVMSYLLNGTVPYILGLDGRRRIAHLALMSILVISLGTGRIHPRSAVAGLSTGVLLATVLAFFKIGGDAYPGRLSGYFGDPNVAGLILAVLGPVIVGSAKTKPRMVLYGGIVVAGILATQSRTALLAAGLALVWAIIGRAATRFQAWFFPIIAITLITNVPREWRTAGAFQNRTGSDWLRDQLLILETQAVDRAPWYGNGPNSAFTWFGDNFFLYHSSYLAARAEGGWPFLLVILGLYVLVFWWLVSLPRQQGNLWMEASVPAVLGMALHLGDVFYSTTSMVFLGMAVWHIRQVRQQISQEATEAAEAADIARAATEVPPAPSAVRWGAASGGYPPGFVPSASRQR